jgi:putative ABC transport system substrate-binding protein
LEVLREIAPATRRLALLDVPTAGYGVDRKPRKLPPSTMSAAENAGFAFKRVSVAKPEDFDQAFADILAWRADALSVAGTTLTVRERHRIVAFATAKRLPSTYTLRSFVEAGGLVSYAVDYRPTFARSAEHVDRILRGANPAELPVDLPSAYELAVNLRTAKALGLEVPQSVLLRADWVIE